MAIRFYDEALVNKIQSWVKDDKMRILSPDETSRLFQMRADLGNDEHIKLPVIAIARDRDIEILNTQKQVKTFDGISLKSNEKVSMPINVIPIQIGYQLDIYTRHMEEADEYIRNFVFNFINYPKIKVVIPYNNAEYEHLSNVYIDSTITDNSDISERLFADQFTRFSLKLMIDDAYLFSLPIKNNIVLESAEYQIQDIDGTVDESGIIYEED